MHPEERDFVFLAATLDGVKITDRNDKRALAYEELAAPGGKRLRDHLQRPLFVTPFPGRPEGHGDAGAVVTLGGSPPRAVYVVQLTGGYPNEIDRITRLPGDDNPDVLYWRSDSPSYPQNSIADTCRRVVHALLAARGVLSSELKAAEGRSGIDAR